MIAKASFQLQVPKRSKACSNCEKVFEGGDASHSLVRDGEGDQSVREDYCGTCWEQVQEERRQEAMTYWTSKIPAKSKSSPDLRLLSRKDRAFVLLRDAIARDDARSTEEAFVLALFLAHGRTIILRKELKRADGTYNLYEENGSGETFCVKHCDLAAVDVEAVQKEIASKMRGDSSEEEGDEITSMS